MKKPREGVRVDSVSWEGASSSAACEACPVGTVGENEGATTVGLCAACLPGRWNGLKGQGFIQNCSKCLVGGPLKMLSGLLKGS